MRERQRFYAALLGAEVYIRRPLERLWPVTDPATGREAIAAFVSEADAVQFWEAAAPQAERSFLQLPFAELCRHAQQVGAIAIDPLGANCVVDRAEMMQLAVGEIPGSFAIWLSEMGRLGRQPAEVTARLRKSFVYALSGKGTGDEQRLFLLEKSDDGTLAVPCFSALDTLTQFLAVRGMMDGHQGYAIALMQGDRCFRIATGMGAYLLIDPESPWEMQLEPSLV